VSREGSGPIDIAWADRRLERDCSTDTAGVRRFGADNWRLLRRRLGTLLGATTLRSMDGAPGRCHALSGDRLGQYALYLWGSFRLVFEPDHDPIPMLPTGGHDRAAITKVRIHEIVNYHDN
jgi:plasmid maintenance system killer protein